MNKIRLRIFDLVAPLKFNSEVSDNLISLLRRLKDETSDIVKLQEIIQSKEAQAKILFSQEPCSCKEDFERLSIKQLQSLQQRDSDLAKFFMALENEVRTIRLDNISERFKQAEIDILQQMSFANYKECNSIGYRNLLSMMVLFPSFFSATDEIESLVSSFEEAEIKF